MAPDREEAARPVEVSGFVYGVHLQGRLPAAFRPYLVPATGPRPGSAPLLEVRYREVHDLPEAEEIWVSRPPDDGPRRTLGRFALVREPGGFGLSVADEGRGLFRFTPGEIRIEWTTPGTGAPHYLVSYALPLWLEARGVPVLHGSAVSLGDRAVGFVGQSGMGKSVLCAELLGLGCGFVADDGLALRRDEEAGARGGWRVSHGPPLLRLWPSGLERRLQTAPHALPRVHEALEKRRLHLPGGGDRPLVEGLPLAALYVLERLPEADASLEIAEHRARDGLVRLLEHGIAGAPAAALGLSGRRLELLADVAERVPVRELRFPSGVDSAERILEAIRPDASPPLAPLPSS